MGRHYFSKGTTFELNDQVYLVRQYLLDGRLLLENQTNGGEERMTRSDLATAWSRGELRFTLRGPSTRRVSQAKPPTAYSFADFQSLPEGQRDEAWRRYNVILPYLKMTRRERGRALRTLKRERSTAFQELQQQAAEQHQELLTKKGKTRRQPPRSDVGHADSPTTIRRWLRAFSDSQGDIRSLVPATNQQGGKDGTRVDDKVEGFIGEAIEWGKLQVTASVRPSVSLDLLRSRVIANIAKENATRDEKEHLTLPSRDTILARVKMHDLHHILSRPLSDVESHADGGADTGPRPTRVLERVELDQTVVDLLVVDDIDRLPIGRPYATYAIDVATGYPYAWYIGYEPNNYYTVQMCLMHGILPSPDVQQMYGTQHQHQSYGLMESLVVDRGRVMIGEDTKQACAELGITLDEMKRKSPWLKGHIERFIRSTNQGLLHELPGTSFSNTVQRGDYNPMKHACISLSAFRQLVYMFMLDYYAERPHKGVRGIPTRRWEAGVQQFPPALPNNAEDLRISLLSTEWCRVWHYGIDVFCMRYQNTGGLSQLRRRLKIEDRERDELKVKYSQNDISVLYVLDPFEQRWITVPPSPEYREYAQGLSVWKHDLIRAYAKLTNDQPDIVALAKAKLEMQRIVEEEFRWKAGRRTRKNATRYLDRGREDAPPTDKDALQPEPEESASSLPAETDAAHDDVPVAPPASDVSSDDTPTEAAAAPRRPRGRPRKEKEPSAAASTAPTDAEPQRDRTGWGGSYRLPRTAQAASESTDEGNSQ